MGALAFRRVVGAALRNVHGGTGGLNVADWHTRVERELAGTAAFVAFGLTAVDLLRLWHQTYAFFGGFEPITRELARTIANETLWGAGWKLQVISAAAAGIAFASAYRSWRGAWVVAYLAVAATTISRPFTGHAVEQGSWLSLPAILQMIHVGAAALWIGTLSVMMLLGVRKAVSLAPDDRAPMVAAMVSGFSPLALGSVTTLFVAGCATSFMYVGSVTAAVSTTYGRVLLLKLTVFGVVAAAGFLNWQKAGPSVEAAAFEGDGETSRALLVRYARFEIAVAALVLAITAALVALPMPMG